MSGKKRKYKTRPAGWSKQEAPSGEDDNPTIQSEDEIEKSKEDELDIKKDGGDEMADINYEKIADMQKKATREIMEELQQPQREAEQIEKAVKKEVSGAVRSEVKAEIESLKPSLIDEIKGLSKEEATQLVEGRFQELIKKECEDPNSLSCQMAKNTASAVLDEVLKKKSEEKKPFEMPKVTDEFEEEWKKLTPEQKKALELIPAKAHKIMLDIITESPESHKGLNRRIFKGLTEEEIAELVKDNPDLVTKFPEAICTTPECKEAWNKGVEASEKIKEEEKSHWLLS